MITFILLFSSLASADPVQVTLETRVPPPSLHALAMAELGPATLNSRENSWQAPLYTGGFVRVTNHIDADTAQRAFAFQSGAVSTMHLAKYPGFGDEAVGDGTALLLVRTGKVVMLVRDDQRNASGVAERVLRMLEKGTYSDPSASP